MPQAGPSFTFVDGERATPVSFRRRPVRTLADDVHEIYRRHGMFDHLCDDDAEPCTWTDDIDQRGRARIGTGRWANDDMEIDDGV